ncbi:hypothetical protein CLU81_1395 [Flavobacterium sp. 9]|uniref:hypothetical protein n=1 Tax=Flavobacterium sp. 9 TaxID=2035198 RepID=UPI000C17E643|nr:hypothetical protein [Flavobacterium sp. 9]PIF30937.1 hypothetical protein CLU81_1395 [Flavobacterium sp. 9]
MNDFLRKINFIKDIVIQLPVSKIDFIEKFRINVDESNLSYEPFEVFQSSTNEYKGYIENNYFELKKRRKLFDMNYPFAKVTGELTQENDQLIINAEISCFRKRMILFLVGILLFYSLFFISMAFNSENKIPFFIVPFLLVHMSLMIGAPYFIIRKIVNKMAYDLERDFHYWVTKY